MFDNLRKALDFDDLLFEGRNRDYGAYQLRKKYNSVLVAGILLGSFLVTSAVVLPFLIKPDSDRVLRGGSTFVSVQMENLEQPPEELYIPPPPPPPVNAPVQENFKYTPPVVVDSVLNTETQLSTVDQALSHSDTEQLVTSGSGNGDNLLSGDTGTPADEPFFLVEIMPSFKGGDINKFREWVQKRTNYPQIAIDNKIQGRVFLTFIVEPDGSVSTVTVIKGVDPIIDNEAMQAIQASPKWTPGLQRGQPVRVRFNMWLSFVL
jgi:periplasmic protein TonB